MPEHGNDDDHNTGWTTTNIVIVLCLVFVLFILPSICVSSFVDEIGHAIGGALSQIEEEEWIHIEEPIDPENLTEEHKKYIISQFGACMSSDEQLDSCCDDENFLRTGGTGKDTYQESPYPKCSCMMNSCFAAPNYNLVPPPLCEEYGQLATQIGQTGNYSLCENV